ncbi:MAG: hypothetical protein EPO32_10690 [Anaerolineae bacterium]|nr:MAG: hypothetical protein EPO32_10690 [Anaerolineae bacterium]
MMLMAWLGLTILLNAERRSWGTRLAGIGLLMGALFFVAHTAILGFGLDLVSRGLAFWWQIGWIPVVGLPWVWYTLLLWYAGYWDDPQASLHRRQRLWFISVTLLGIGLFAILLVVSPLENYEQAALLNPGGALSLGQFPKIVILYPIYSFLCMVLAIDALRKPGPTRRAFGELARERARPWLLGVSIIFLIVSLLVAAILGLVVIWVSLGSLRQLPDFLRQQALIISLFDLAIASLIGLAVLLLGEAVVAYEVFTGQALPRHGFLRQWRRAILLAAGFGGVVSFFLLINFREIYTILFSALLITAFYALLSWRSYTERQRFIDDLRPFVSNQSLFESLLAPGELEGKQRAETIFNALCRDVLNARVAYLIPLGASAPLAGPPLSFPSGQSTDFSGLPELMRQFTTAAAVALPIPPGTHRGAAWAVPLWNARGPSGLLLLGDKRDGGLYTQEEIEIAQTSSERLIDTLATAEFGQRLMLLQRQRITETQILDQQTRRILHDEILPDLHTALLKLSSDRESTGAREAIELLSSSHGRISELLREMPAAAQPQLKKQGMVGALRHLLEIEMANAFDSVHWQVESDAELSLSLLPSTTAEVVYYAAREVVRNAARHARNDATRTPLNLSIRVHGKENLEIIVDDDGVGISEPDSGPDTGHGLALHSTLMAVIGGELSLESEPGKFTRVRLSIPRET